MKKEKGDTPRDELAARRELEEALESLLANVDKKYSAHARAKVLATVDRAVAW